MENRGRYARVVCVAVLLAVVTVAGRPSRAVSQAVPPAPSIVAVVHAFFIQPNAKPATSRTLIGFSAESVTRSEHVITACSGCGRTRFVGRYSHHRVALRAVPALRMRPTTRVLVAVIETGQTGRWIEFGFGRQRYGGVGNGCMAMTVKSLTPAETSNPTKSIPFTTCGAWSGPGTEYVYWTGTDHQIYEKQYPADTPSRWSDSLAIGSGTGVLSAPSAIIRGKGERDVFWEGFDHHLHWMSFTGDWHDETELPAGTVRSGPTAIVDAKGYAHVFWKGTTRLLYEMSNIGTIPQTTPLNAGDVGSVPAAVSRPDGTVDLFWKGTDKLLWGMPQASASLGANCIPGANTLGSAPAAALDAHLIEDVFWRGTGDGGLWELSRPDDPRSISTPQGLPGALGSAPTVVIHPNNVQDVFWRGTHGGLWEMVWPTKNPWNTAQQIRSEVKVASRPAVVLSPPAQRPVNPAKSTAEDWYTPVHRATVSKSCPS
jgi:hypothetical protein